MSKRVKQPGLAKARAFKRAGGTKETYLVLVKGTIDKAAKEQGWRDSERAMAIADKMQIADDVWGKS